MRKCKYRHTARIFTALTLAAGIALSSGMSAWAAGEAWLDYEIPGKVTEQTNVRLQDDFGTAVNKEWVLSTELPEGYSRYNVFMECNKLIRERKLALIGDTTIKDHNKELVTDLYEMAIDWEARDAQGIKPLLPYITRIRNISSLDSLTEYLKDPANMSGLVQFAVENSVVNSGNYVVYLDFPDRIYEDTEDYDELSAYAAMQDELARGKATYMLRRLGYSMARTKQLYEDCIALERELAAYDYTGDEKDSDEYEGMQINEVGPEDIRKAQGAFPMDEVIEGQGFVSRTYNLNNSKLLAALDSIYDAEHLSKIKAYLLVHTVIDSIGLADKDAYDYVGELVGNVMGTTGTVSTQEYGYNCVESYLTYPMDYLYIDTYCTVDMKNAAEELVDRYKQYYVKLLSGETWMSKETRQKAIEKVQSIKAAAAYPEKRWDYSTLTLSDLRKGGSYFDAVMRVTEYANDQKRSLIDTKPDDAYWPDMPASMVNAFYDPTENKVYILAGVMVEPVYSEDAGLEELLGSLGTIIGHEITHAFDSKGAQYDKDGNFGSWWTDEDYAIFRQRTKATAAYMSSIVPDNGSGEAVNGNQVLGETIADMGSVRASLTIASDTDGFDYDEFFKSYARLWRTKSLVSEQIRLMKLDGHPLGYLRVNSVLTQFQEFYDTYDVKPGDGMYTAPQDRVAVW